MTQKEKMERIEQLSMEIASIKARLTSDNSEIGDHKVIKLMEEYLMSVPAYASDTDFVALIGRRDVVRANLATINSDLTVLEAEVPTDLPVVTDKYVGKLNVTSNASDTVITLSDGVTPISVSMDGLTKQIDIGYCGQKDVVAVYDGQSFTKTAYFDWNNTECNINFAFALPSVSVSSN